MKLTAAIVQEDDWYVARCLEVEVASQGKSVEESLRNLQELWSFTLRTNHRSRP